ncbi:class I SAM-dependent methyltransferase [Acidiferrimicrobium sp. IK]|nr:class I SAM-dependent methyltransferase [Acidiferrimicrobium sp. IK]
MAAHTGPAYLRYSFTKGTAQEVEWLTGALGLHRGTRVLDVGCGPGRHSLALRERGIETVGLDISLAFLRAGGPGPWVRSDARSLPFPTSSFDAVVCLCQGGFGLLGGHGEATALSEMARVLAPGGLLGLSAFSAYFAVRYLEEGDTFDADTGVNHEAATVRDPSGREAAFDLWTTCFTPRELRLMAADAGLRVRELWSVAPGSYAARAPDVEHPEWLMIAEKSA